MFSSKRAQHFSSLQNFSVHSGQESDSDASFVSSQDNEQPNFIYFNNRLYCIYQPDISRPNDTYQPWSLNEKVITVSRDHKEISKMIKKTDIKDCDGIRIIFKESNAEKDHSEDQKPGSPKNIFRILGAFILSTANKMKNQKEMQEILESKSKKIDYENINLKKNKEYNYESFIKWLQDNKFKKNLTKKTTFKEVWGYYLPMHQNKSLKDKHFCYVLTKISKICLRGKFLQYLYKKLSRGSMKLYNVKCYISKLPILNRAVKDPENFHSLSDD